MTIRPRRIFCFIAVAAVCSVGVSLLASEPGKLISAAHDGLPEVRVGKKYELTANELSAFPANVLSGDAPTAVAWSSDGTELATISDYGRRLHIWITAGGAPTVLTSNTNYIHNSLEFLDDHDLLTAAERGTEETTFSVWNIQSGSIVKTVKGPEYNEARIYTLSADKSMAVNISAATGRPIWSKTKLTENAGMTPTQIIASENPVPLYSTKTWEILHLIYVTAPTSVAFSPDGKQVAFGAFDGQADIVIYDTATGHLIKKIYPYGDALHPSITALSYSPDGENIVIGITLFGQFRNVKPVRAYRVSDGTLVAAFPDDAAPDNCTVHIKNVAWNQKHNVIAFFSACNHNVYLWDPVRPDDQGSVIHLGSESTCLKFSPDGTQLAACEDGGIQVFDLKF
jgi:WD40 repeat protein